MDEKEIKDEEIETEDIIIEEVKEVVIDEENMKEWNEFNEKWRTKIHERKHDSK